MQEPRTLLRVGVVGTAVAALCCFTPILWSSCSAWSACPR